MKKIAIILLLCIYTASVVGVSVNRFYCCGRLQSTTVSVTPFSQSGTKDDDCCKHKQNILQVSDSHEWSAAAKVAKSGFVFIHTVFNSYANILVSASNNFARSSPVNGPPLLHTPLYTQFCNYRI